MACRGEVLQGKGTKQRFRDEMLPSYEHVGPMGSGGGGVWEMPQGWRGRTTGQQGEGPPTYLQGCR